MLQAPKRSVRRPGFTLIEMLIVIAIIVVLVSLTAAAAMRMMGTQQSANTRSELSKVQVELQKGIRAFEDKVSKEPIPIPGSQLGNVYYKYVYDPQNPTAGMAGGDTGRAQVIWRKLRLKQAFPQTFNEALSPAPMPPLKYYSDALGLLGYTTANTTTAQPWESSVLLLMALQRGEGGNTLTVEDLGVSSFIHDFGPTPNNQTVKGLIDGWGNPLVFCRWPVNSAVLNPNGQAQAKANNDAGDPSGLLESASWQGTAGYTQFLGYCHAVGQAPQANKDATSYRIFPMIASSGPDGVLGLNPLTFQALPSSGAADNLYPTLAPTQ